MPRMKALAIALACFLAVPATALAAQCGNDGGGFSGWLAQYKNEARAAGFSARTLSALDGVTYHRTVIRLDRQQSSGKRPSLESYLANRVTSSRIRKGRQMLATHAGLLANIEARYGVPREIVVAIWGLETDFGVNQGKMNAIRSLATLAYDCRRSEFFTNELNSALSIIQRGDMRPDQMRGAWAGELGQTQFLASSYLRFAVDFDRNGRRDLIRSIPDALGSTANYLKGYGWRRGAGYGPGSQNAAVLAHWNRSSYYQQAIALFARRLAGG